MNRDKTKLVIIGLSIAVLVLGILYYQERQRNRIDINFGESGISIEGP